MSFDATAALYTLGVVGFCTLLAGIVPALSLSHSEIGAGLASAGRGGDASRGGRARFGFAAAEIAIGLALVISAGLLMRSFVALVDEPLGFSPQNVLALHVQYGIRATTNDATIVDFHERVATRVRAIPGVIDDAFGGSALFAPGGSDSSGVQLAGRAVPPGEMDSVPISLVDGSYFDVVRIPLLRGRRFGSSDTRKSRPTVIVSENFARRYFQSEGPLGKRIRISYSYVGSPYRTIVGIVANARESLHLPPGPHVYLPLSQEPDPDAYLFVRHASGVGGIGPAASVAVTSVDPFTPPPPHATPMSNWITAQAGRNLIAMVLLSILAAIALVLAVAGVYAVVSYGVAQRTHEFGIRRALGARDRDILRGVVIRAARLAALGIVAGLVLAVLLAGPISDELYNVSPFDPLTYAAVRSCCSRRRCSRHSSRHCAQPAPTHSPPCGMSKVLTAGGVAVCPFIHTIGTKIAR